MIFHGKRIDDMITDYWFPLWRDMDVNLTDLTSQTLLSYRYRVRSAEDEMGASDTTSGTVIYTGIASPAPDSDVAQVRVNSIIADHLAAAGNTLGGWYALDWFDESLSEWTHLWTGYALADYSHDRDFILNSRGLSYPIRKVLAPNQYLVISGVDYNNTGYAEFTITYRDGTGDILQRPIIKYQPFNEAFNMGFGDSGEVSVPEGYAGINLALYPNIASIDATIGDYGELYEVRQDTCKRYCLYYRNAYGGYDSLLLDGAVRSEEYTRATIGRKVDNNIAGYRDTFDYRNDIAEGWVLRVNGLKDEEAARMPQLVGSVDVWLCDLNTGVLTPLVLTDTQCEVKTFRNQGGRRLDYTLTARTAQRRERR